MQTNEEVRTKIRESHCYKTGTRGFLSKATTPCFRTCISAAFFFFFLDILALKIDRADAVPDPEPKLLDSNFVEPSKLQLLFRPSGKYAASTHYIHIRVPFNFSRLTLMPDIIFDRYHRYIEIWPEPHKTQVEQIAELSRSCLADKHNDFNNMLDALPQHEVVTREKRFLDLVSLGMSTAALTLASFNSAKISHLETQIVNNNKRLDHLVDITALHENHFKAVDQKLDDMATQLAHILRYDKVKFSKLTDLMEQKFGTAVAISERLIHTAYANKLSPGALDHEALVAAVKYVNEIAQNSDMLSFVHKPSDLFLVETSYIYKPEDKTFVLVLHVPLVTPHNLMPLYEFIPLPVHFNFSGNVSVTPEVGINNMIAVGHSQSYQELSSTDLQGCNKMGETYFCKGRNVLLTDLTKTCLGALYLADNKNIQGRCKFSIGGAQEKIFRLDSNTYVVYSLGKISTNHVCPKAKTISAVQISSGQTVRINPSCYIRTMDHIITADDSEEIAIHSKWLDWTWTLGQLFQQSENEVVTAAIAKLRTKISGKFDAEVLLHELETMTKEAKELAKEVPFNHWIFTSPGAMIGATLVCLFILFCCWRLCRSNTSAPPIPYPTAPPAPPTVFNMTVDPIRR
jgi:hypothetical protein